MMRQLLTLPRCQPVVVFEGGYHLQASAACAEAVLRELLLSPAAPPAEGDATVSPAGSLCEHTEELLRQVLRFHAMHMAGTCYAQGVRIHCTRHALHMQVLAVHAEFWPCLATPAHRTFADAYFRARSESSRRCVKRRQPQSAPPREKPAKGGKPKGKESDGET